jgi:hypothetical protein
VSGRLAVPVASAPPITFRAVGRTTKVTRRPPRRWRSRRAGPGRRLAWRGARRRHSDPHHDRENEEPRNLENHFQPSGDSPLTGRRLHRGGRGHHGACGGSGLCDRRSGALGLPARWGGGPGGVRRPAGRWSPARWRCWPSRRRVKPGLPRWETLLRYAPRSTRWVRHHGPPVISRNARRLVTVCGQTPRRTSWSIRSGPHRRRLGGRRAGRPVCPSATRTSPTPARLRPSRRPGRDRSATR